MSTAAALSPQALRIDPAAEAERIVASIRDAVFHQLRRQGAVVGVSGGIDSSVVAFLCARALGPGRVLALCTPEDESSPDSLRLGQLVAHTLNIRHVVENVGPILKAAGCYSRRDDAIRLVVPEYGEGYKCKLVLPGLTEASQYALFSVVVQAPSGEARRVRLTAAAYLGIVAATNCKQRTRKMVEYYYADLQQYAVAGTPNRLEYDLGFFVKNGDGAADFKPIAHLYKSQVYQLAAYLGVPEEIQKQLPTTDTYSLPQSQEEFYFMAPLEKMDWCLYGKDHGIPAAEVAAIAGMAEPEVARMYRFIEGKRRVAALSARRGGNGGAVATRRVILMAQRGNVADYLLDGKALDAIALRMLSGDHSYGDLRRAVAQVAENLVSTEPPGSRILLVGENSFFWVAAYLGTMKAGMVSVPLPASLPARDLGSIVSLTEARTAFLQTAFLRNHAAELAGIRVIGPADLACAPPPTGRPLPDVDSGDLAAIMFTSGSTAGPRGVMVSHANIMANTESIIQYLALTANDRIMTVLPFHYCFGTSLLHTHLRVGASLVIDPRFMYPEAVLQRMADTECTGFAGVPSHFQILLRRSSLKKRTFPHLRYVQQAGGHLAPVFIRELRAALPQTRIFIMYGQTEATARLSYLPPELLDGKTGSIGKGIPGVNLRVLNTAGQPVAPGEVGEIVAEGANVARGYWRAPEEESHSFRDGRLYTGDLATVDAEGFLYVVDRSKDFLKCGGERVSSRQIEEQLLECEELLEVAVIGTADDLLGEAVMAFVVPREGGCSGPCHWPTCRGIQERVRLFAREHLRPKLAPKALLVFSSLPKNGTGKVLKAELKKFAIQ